jgi:hypothetical protein
MTRAAISLAVAWMMGPSRLTSSVMVAGDQGIATLMAAATSPELARTGAAIDHSALSSSSSLVAMPARRTWSSSASSAFLFVWVRGPRWRRSMRSRRSGRDRACPAHSRTCCTACRSGSGSNRAQTSPGPMFRSWDPAEGSGSRPRSRRTHPTGRRPARRSSQAPTGSRTGSSRTRLGSSPTRPTGHRSHLISHWPRAGA